LAVAGKLNALYIEASAVRGQNINEIFENIAVRISEGAVPTAPQRTAPQTQDDECVC
jgi:ribosomal protein L12E/L44/L45/RPP1/RPP2